METATNIVEFFTTTTKKLETMKDFLTNWGYELSVYTEDWETVNTVDIVNLMQNTITNEFSAVTDWDDIATWNSLCEEFADNLLNYMEVYFQTKGCLKSTQGSIL